MRRALALVAAAGALAVACTSPDVRSEPYQPPALRGAAEPDSGFEWFQRDCAWCHGSAGEGTFRGPPLTGGRNGAALADFVLRTGRMPIEDPSEPARRGPQAYSDETIEQIVGYLDSLADGPAIPIVDPESGDLALGRQLYQTNCAACHSATGIGGTLTPGFAGEESGRARRRTGVQVPGVLDSSALEIAEAMITGPGTMPVFDRETFGAHELQSILRYVLFLQDPGRGGGVELGRVGPVAEGAVAWIVGLGAMLALARWIGSRTGSND